VDDGELGDEALDRPAHPDLACVTVSTGPCEFCWGRRGAEEDDDTELIDVALDRPALGRMCWQSAGPCVPHICSRDGLVDDGELADEALDRPAHPDLACVTVSTGEFTWGRRGVDAAVRRSALAGRADDLDAGEGAG
jgi:hypothetical protein